MKEQGNTGEYHKADPAYRRLMQVVLAVAVVVGIGALVGMQLWLARAARGDVGNFAHSLNLALGSLCLALGLVGAFFTLWLFKLAAATRAERRWPPSGMRTSADVRIRYLTSADSMVAQMKGGALGLALVAAGMLAWGAWLLRAA